MNTIRIASKQGDTPFTYDPETQLEEARGKFNELKNQGYMLFGIDPETHETTQLDQLFKEHVQVIAIPQISGG